MNYDAGSFGGRVSDNIFEFDDVGMASECLKDFNLSFHFAFFDRFESLDNDMLVILSGHTSVYFRVFAFSYFGDDLVFFDISNFRDITYAY